jgi:hypothetical protein
MAIKTWKATVKLPTGMQQQVTVQADSPWNAKAMLEAQYGKGCVKFGPQEVRTK